MNLRDRYLREGRKDFANLARIMVANEFNQVRTDLRLNHEESMELINDLCDYFNAQKVLELTYPMKIKNSNS